MCTVDCALCTVRCTLLTDTKSYPYIPLVRRIFRVECIVSHVIRVRLIQHVAFPFVAAATTHQTILSELSQCSVIIHVSQLGANLSALSTQHCTQH